MATNYTGNPSATQAPGPQPKPGVFPIMSIPADGDDLDAASVDQAFKESADFIAFLQTSPLQMGSYYWLAEDFDSSALSGKFASSGTASVVTNDSTAGGIGAYKLNPGSAGSSSLTTTATLPAVSGDFFINFSIRVPNVFAATSVAEILFTGTAFTHYIRIGFVSTVNSGRWSLGVDGLLSIDLGVAPSASYQLFSIQRINGVLSILINGAVKYTAAYASSVDSGSLGFVVENATGDSTSQIIIDYVKLWIQR